MNEPEYGEPWTAWKTFGSTASVVPGGDIDTIHTDMPVEIADRIVACVNFLAGVPTELLKRISDPSFVNGREAGSLLFKVPPLQSRPSFKMELE